METETCTMCNIENHIDDFHKKSTECKDCNSKKI